jgi:hypothetical protein
MEYITLIKTFILKALLTIYKKLFAPTYEIGVNVVKYFLFKMFRKNKEDYFSFGSLFSQ